MVKLNSKKAFTLTEIILVTLILGILALIALPRMGGRVFFDRWDARTVAHQITADIRYAQQLAITNSTDYTVSFNFAGRTYDILRGAASIDRDFPKLVPTTITLSGTNQFVFQRLGNATLGGTLTVTCGARSYTVTVEQATGVVIMQDIP